MAAALTLPEPLCAFLIARGFRTEGDIRRYLRPALTDLHSPDGMLGMDRAVHRLAGAIRTGETVFVHGDYDVDGMTSTAFLTRTIRALGGRAVPFVPHRVTDGYDLTDAGVRAAQRVGAGLVVTCDCGTSARQPVAQLRALGIDVIISDHHLPGGPLPDALALLNPRQPGCGYPDKDLAAAGVVFKLGLALTRAMGADDALVMSMLDLIALATIADVVPLRGENRILARHGLRQMATSQLPGVRAMVRAAGVEGKELTAGRVGFILAPRLNAAGRIGHAMRGVELLLSDDDSVALGIARELEELNQRRQDQDRAMLEAARGLLDRIDLDDTFGIVLANEAWHPGVIGIVASRIVEETGRPTMMIAIDGEVGKGSGRSIPAFDLHAALRECSDLFLRFGGHRAAAGITIDRARIPDFVARFNDVARQRLTPDDFAPEIRADLELPLSAATDKLFRLLRHCEPHGMGNPAPVFIARGVRADAAPRRVGENGVRVRLTDDAVAIDAIAWDFARRIGSVDWMAPMDVAFRMERDDWNGRSRLQLRIADVRQ